MNSNGEPFALRLYRSLLFAYPAEFRREYGREMLFVFQHRWAEERGAGALRLWLEVFADVVTTASREHLAQVAADVRYAVRVLRSNPGFAVVAVIVLALGISASATAFTVLNATLIRPLPYPEADRLLFIDHIPKKEARHLPFSTHEFFALRQAQTTLSEVGAFQELELTLRGDFEPQRIRATYVAGRLLPLLEVKPILGRLFTDEEDRPGAPKGAPVLSARDTPPTNQVWVSPGFFNTLRIPVLGGRDFTWADQNPGQAIVDKTLADRYWPGRSAVGPVGFLHGCGPLGDGSCHIDECGPAAPCRNQA